MNRPPRDAATVMLLRDGVGGVEVFMVVRHAKTEFGPGALVFPGGSVDAADHAPAVRESVPASLRDLPEAELALRAAVVREAYEEAGVLLARRLGGETLLGGSELDALGERHAADRDAHRLDIGALAEAEGLELACDLLVPFAHWVTPAWREKRFDTRFYLAPAPPGQVAVHDGSELVDSVWRTPAQVLAEADAGDWNLMFPTRMNLEKLGRSTSVEEALSVAAASKVVKVAPEVEHLENGRRFRLPAEAGYSVTEVILDEEGRFLLRR